MSVVHYRADLADGLAERTACGRKLDNGEGTVSDITYATCKACLKRFRAKRRISRPAALGAPYGAPEVLGHSPGYKLDPYRLALPWRGKTGFTVPLPIVGGGTGNFDVSLLTRDSFLTWLRSQDTHPDRDPGYEHRERIILKVLGYES